MIDDSNINSDWCSSQRVGGAIVLIAVGAIFLLNNLQLVRVRDILNYWPAILMVWGVWKLADAEVAQQRTLGGIVFLIGAIFMADNLGLIPFNVWSLWPVALIAGGVYMLIDRTSGPHFDMKIDHESKPRGPHTWTRHETAVFSGGRRRINVEDFSAAKYDCVFGGFELDFRGSQIQGDSAILEINAVFGGAEVKVPANWNVVMQGAGVFGGMVDSTEHSLPANAPGVKNLFVRGAAVFGGVEVKN